MPRKLFSTLACCAATASLLAAPLLRAHAQEPAQPGATLPPQLIANLEKLRDAALSSDYAWKQIAHLTENIGPRLTGSPQATEAANYVAGEMRKLGLDVKLEKTMVPHWVRGEERAELTVYPGQAPHTTQRIVLTALGNSPATAPDGLNAEVVVVNNFDEPHRAWPRKSCRPHRALQ